MWSPTHAACCDQGLSGLARHVIVSPVRGFSITTSRAQPASKQPPAIITAAYRKLPSSPLVRTCEGGLPGPRHGDGATATDGRLHCPPPSAWNNATVSDRRAACAWTRVTNACQYAC